MDEGNPLYLNKTPKQILGEMGIRIDSELQISEKYDEFILAWMADIYTYMQWKYAIPSEKIAEKIRPEDLYKKYYPLHEASIENAVDKLKKFILYKAELERKECSQWVFIWTVKQDILYTKTKQRSHILWTSRDY